MLAGIMKLFDSLQILDQQTTPEGFLRVKARVSRVGIQDYYLMELPSDGLPDRFTDVPTDAIVRLYRPPEEVFADSSLGTIVNKPVTDGHPPVFVDSENYRNYSRGFVAGNPTVDGDFVTVDLLVQDKQMIDRIKQGVKQVSLGYNVDIDWTEGLDEKHGVYDGIQRNIRVNHIAIVAEGRAGPRVRIADESRQKSKEKSDMATRLVDGITVEFTDQGAQVVDKLLEQIDGMTSALDTAKKEALDASAKAEKLEGEIAVKDAKISELESQDLDSLVSARMEVIDAARKLHSDIDPAGKTDLEIKIEAVKAFDEKFNLEDKSADYVDGVFSALLSAKPAEKSAMDKALSDSAKSEKENKDARTRGRELLMARSAKKAWDKE
jgi:hypothetical protein